MTLAAAMKCPVCRSQNCRAQLRVTSQEAAAHFRSDIGSAQFGKLRQAIEGLWQQSYNDLSQCDDCGFGFAWPYVAGDSQFYALAYETIGYPAEKWDFVRGLEAVQQHGLAPQRVLEIGAGYGFFLDKLVACLPVRPTILATEFGLPALQQLRAKEYEARDTDVRELGTQAPFDLICGFQVLEHLGDLDRLAATIDELLKPGGHAMFAVPNAALIAFNTSNDSMLDMPPNHIGQWSRAAFVEFGRKCRLDLIEFDVQPHSLGGIIKMDIGYSYLRRAQQNGTLANWARRHRTAKWGKAVAAGVALVQAPLRLPVWAAASRRSDLGESAFALFRKPEATLM